ncbi:MAG: serine protein kinase, partial [Gemmatimonadetes bacterium]|nr:serine protein kinase [Gemmatimonadota bacterium]
MSRGAEIINRIRDHQDTDHYQKLNWTGSFEQYLDMVLENPKLVRTAYQRVYDMVLSYGSSEYEDSKKRIVHYDFFDDPMTGGEDAIFGLDVPLMKLVNIFKAGAYQYGPEKRILLLHGPVGSSKST